MGGAQLTQQQNLRPVFLVGLGGQCALYLVLLLVQDDVEDTGLCIFLLFFGAILLGLQSAQSVDHWKQHKGGGDAGHLLYKLTKRMSFHGKMIFFPMVFIIITMSAATNSFVWLPMSTRKSPELTNAVSGGQVHVLRGGAAAGAPARHLRTAAPPVRGRIRRHGSELPRLGSDWGVRERDAA